MIIINRALCASFHFSSRQHQQKYDPDGSTFSMDVCSHDLVALPWFHHRRVQPVSSQSHPAGVRQVPVSCCSPELLFHQSWRNTGELWAHSWGAGRRDLRPSAAELNISIYVMNYSCGHREPVTGQRRRHHQKYKHLTKEKEIFHFNVDPLQSDGRKWLSDVPKDMFPVTRSLSLKFWRWMM